MDDLGILLLFSYFIIIAILAVTLTVLRVIGYWKLFNKAGEKGWKSLIPFYNQFVFYRLVWNVEFFFLYLGGSVIVGILNGFERVFDNPFLGFICMVISIAFTIITIWINWHLSINTAKAYGKGKGYGIGLFFLPNLLRMILGFSDCQYQGAQE